MNKRLAFDIVWNVIISTVCMSIIIYIVLTSIYKHITNTQIELLNEKTTIVFNYTPDTSYIPSDSIGEIIYNGEIVAILSKSDIILLNKKKTVEAVWGLLNTSVINEKKEETPKSGDTSTQ